MELAAAAAGRFGVADQRRQAIGQSVATSDGGQPGAGPDQVGQNLAVQRLGAAQTEEQREALRAQLQAVAPERLFREAEIAGLESRLPRSRWARLVPRRWWDRVFDDGDPLYRVSLRIRALLAACLGVALWGLMPTPEPPLRSFRFVPDSMTLTRTGPGLRLSVTADSVDRNTIWVEDTAIGALEGVGEDQALAREPGRGRVGIFAGRLPDRGRPWR